MFIKLVFPLLISLVVVSCHSYNQIATDHSHDMGENKYFNLIKATVEKWSSPINNGTKRTEYYFTISINTTEKLVFDSAWIMNKSFPVFIMKERPAISNEPIVYGKGDTIMVRISAQSAQEKTNAPFHYDGDALISYKINNGQKYFIIKKITTLATPLRQ